MFSNRVVRTNESLEIMPKILDRLVGQLQRKGVNKNSSYAIAVSKLQKSGNLKRGTAKPTTRGIARGNMTPSQRAKNRAAKRSGNSTANYNYNYKTNRATLRKNKNVKRIT